MLADSESHTLLARSVEFFTEFIFSQVIAKCFINLFFPLFIDVSQNVLKFNHHFQRLSIAFSFFLLFVINIISLIKLFVCIYLSSWKFCQNFIIIQVIGIFISQKNPLHPPLCENCVT